MQISKDQIVEVMRERGADAKAQLAEQQLPDKVDLEKDADRLARIGIAPQDLSMVLPGELARIADGDQNSDERRGDHKGSSSALRPRSAAKGRLMTRQTKGEVCSSEFSSF